MSGWPKVAVVGGSIGGLTSAILLRDLGCEVDVYERSTARLADRGAGIVVLPITERLLEEYDRNDKVLTLKWWKYVDAEGKELCADPDNFRFTRWSTIYEALLGIFGGDRYHLHSEVVSLGNHPEAGEATLHDGRTINADLLVGADGIQSTCRDRLLRDAVPVYAGYVAWRGVTDEASLSAETQDQLADAMVYQILEHSHILVYAIPGPDGSTEVGERSINFVWYRNYARGAAFSDVMTGSDGEERPSTMPPGLIRPELMNEMKETATKTLAAVLAEVVHKAEDILIQAIFDLESTRMVFDRTCLLGDAAFAVRPHVAAGQAKACADGWALRGALRATAGDVPWALAEWEDTQLQLGRDVVERSRQMGQRVQFDEALEPGDPDWKFGLYGPRR